MSHARAPDGKFVYMGRGRGRGRGVSKPPQGKPVSSVTSTTSIKTDPANDPCKRITVNLVLDEKTDQWLLNLKSNWNILKHAPSVVKMLIDHIEMSANPYEEVLRLMYNSLDFKSSKPKTLAYFVMAEFKVWLSSNRNKVAHLLTVDIKVSAFNVVRQQSLFALMKLVSSIYEMSADCDIFLDIVHYLIQAKQYKEACQSVILLRLYNKFGIEQFLVPLILQDQTALVESFLDDSRRHQLSSDLVIFLDTHLGSATGVKSSLEPFVMQYKIPNVKWDKLHHKPYRKLVTRLKKKYSISDELTPQLIKRQNEGALQFLVHRRYVENSSTKIGDESFKEMVHEAVKQDQKLQVELVTQVAQYGDFAMAVEFAKFYELPECFWPYNVWQYDQNPNDDRTQPRQQNSYDDENWDEEPSNVECYQLKLPPENIHLIDSDQQLYKFLEVDMKGVELLGVDCEWKPTFGSQKNELALIQLATKTDVFIVDVITIGYDNVEAWYHFGEVIFNNADIIKLGFGLMGDISMIVQSLKGISMNQKIGFLDLMVLSKHLDKESKFKYPYEVQVTGPSLGSLVHQCLGRPLDKSDQFSNWEKRPLRQSQLEYASLDAYCLIEIYDVLQEHCKKFGTRFEEIVLSIMNSVNMPLKKSKKSSQKKKIPVKCPDQAPNPKTDPVHADEIKLVCDTMLGGLGRALRKCGIDTEILENDEDHMECVRFYQDQGRLILTRGHIFDKLNGNVPPGCCFKVTSDDIDEQLKQVIDYFHIVVNKEHVFSRCMVCNANSFAKLSKETMQLIAATIKKGEIQKALPPPPAGYDEESSGDEFEDDIFSSDDRFNKSNKHWDAGNKERVDMSLCETRLGAKIQIEVIPEPLLYKIDLFYVCEVCGKVYWDGSHLDRILSGRLQGIVAN